MQNRNKFRLAMRPEKGLIGCSAVRAFTSLMAYVALEAGFGVT
jgi:hypothetical protein